MFLFKKVKGKKRLKAQASLEVLSRLNNYLDENVEEPVEFLVGFWKDQEDAFTYKEIRQAILDGAISEETMRLWMQDYSILVAEKMYPVWEKALAAGPFGQPIMDAFADEFVFDTHTASVLSWINERGADFITAVTQEQKKAIKAMLARHVDGTYTVDELSRVIRPCIGLTESQAKANLRYYDSVKAKLLEQHPKMKPENARKKAREAAMKYAEKQHRQRAYDIAQTEMAFAYNKGADEGIRQAQSQNLLGVMEKRWSTSGDSNVCDICRALDGTQIPMDDEFDFKGKILFAGQKRTPPAHPKCACAVLYIEVSPPVFKEGRSG